MASKHMKIKDIFERLLLDGVIFLKKNLHLLMYQIREYQQVLGSLSTISLRSWSNSGLRL